MGGVREKEKKKETEWRYTHVSIPYDIALYRVPFQKVKDVVQTVFKNLSDAI